MGFKKSIIMILLQCAEKSITDNNYMPLTRLDNGTNNLSLAVKVSDIDGNTTYYSYQKFVEIVDFVGLDGFIF